MDTRRVLVAVLVGLTVAGASCRKAARRASEPAGAAPAVAPVAKPLGAESGGKKAQAVPDVRRVSTLVARVSSLCHASLAIFRRDQDLAAYKAIEVVQTIQRAVNDPKMRTALELKLPVVVVPHLMIKSASEPKPGPLLDRMMVTHGDAWSLAAGPPADLSVGKFPAFVVVAVDMLRKLEATSKAVSSVKKTPAVHAAFGLGAVAGSLAASLRFKTPLPVAVTGDRWLAELRENLRAAAARDELPGDILPVVAPMLDRAAAKPGVSDRAVEAALRRYEKGFDVHLLEPRKTPAGSALPLVSLADTICGVRIRHPVSWGVSSYSLEQRFAVAGGKEPEKWMYDESKSFDLVPIVRDERNRSVTVYCKDEAPGPAEVYFKAVLARERAIRSFDCKLKSSASLKAGEHAALLTELLCGTEERFWMRNYWLACQASSIHVGVQYRGPPRAPGDELERIALSLRPDGCR